MKRKIIKINKDLCDGCGKCADACHEQAIAMVDGKAQLIRDDYCDGLGDCLPSCPTGAITFEEREAAEYDILAVENAKSEKLKRSDKTGSKLPCGCPSTQSKTIERSSYVVESDNAPMQVSQLNQWPVQIKLVPVNAPYFDGAKLLVAADCAAYAYGAFHKQFMQGKVTLIGCPKLDNEDYSRKLTEIISKNNIKSVMVVRMEVPCCSGIENAVKTALKDSGKHIPWGITVISTDGKILE